MSDYTWNLALNKSEGMTETEWENFTSHRFHYDDNTRRCMDCEIGVWNAHKHFCVNTLDASWKGRK